MSDELNEEGIESTDLFAQMLQCRKDHLSWLISDAVISSGGTISDELLPHMEARKAIDTLLDYFGANNMRKERREINDQLLNDLWSFLCDCEKAGDRTRRTALTEASQAHGEGVYRMARDAKHRMVILEYKPSSQTLCRVRGGSDMSECGCINIHVCEYVDEESENYRCIREKSDTPFFCDECEETLPAGTLREHEKYLNAKNEEQEHTVCVNCLSVLDVFFCQDYYRTRIWEDVNDHIRELDGQISSECLLSLTPRARDKMFDLIQACWDDLNKDDDEDDE
jgi:hypothetical protein